MMASSPRPYRILVADDELLARQRIEDLLAERDDVEIAVSVATGPETVAAIRLERPDLVFLDIQMPGFSGLDVVERIGPDEMPMTIFVTAFDQHAVRAFDLAAVDYLVKPFDDDRFHAALERALRHLSLTDADLARRQLVTLLQTDEAGDLTAPPPTPDEHRQWLERIRVESRGEARALPVSRIEYITASGPYAELHAGGQLYLIRERMQNLESQLEPGVFFRIHRSAIVRLEQVDAFLRSAGGDYAVRMKDGTELSVSRARREELEKRMGLKA